MKRTDNKIIKHFKLKKDLMIDYYLNDKKYNLSFTFYDNKLVSILIESYTENEDYDYIVNSIVFILSNYDLLNDVCDSEEFCIYYRYNDFLAYYMNSKIKFDYGRKKENIKDIDNIKSKIQEIRSIKILENF